MKNMKRLFLAWLILCGVLSLSAAEIVTITERNDTYDLTVIPTIGIGKIPRDERLTAPFVLVAERNGAPVYRISVALTPGREPGSRVGRTYLPDGLRWDRITLHRADLAFRGNPISTLSLVGTKPIATILHPALAPAIPAALPPYSVEKIQDTGPDDKRIVWVIMGDGYTAGEMNKFKSDVETMIDTFFAEAPWKNRRGAFNIYRVDVVSNESGADHPEQDPPVFVDTALGSYYGCYNIDRLICIDDGTALSIAGAVAAYDTVLVLVNDPIYGGSGGAISVASTHYFSSEVVLHEFGHSFGLLADEYEDPYPGYPDGDWEPNVSYAYNFDRSQIKWGTWISPLTPLPTPEGAGYANDAGMFEGARYKTTGIYRPKEDCKMRTVGSLFCDICVEAQALQIYNRTSLLDSAEPAPGTTVPYTAGLSVTVQTLPCEALSVSFTLNGTPLSGAACAMGTCTQPILAEHLVPGTNTLTAHIADTSGEIRVDPSHLSETTIEWQILYEETTPDADPQPDSDMATDLATDPDAGDLPDTVLQPESDTVTDLDIASDDEGFPDDGLRPEFDAVDNLDADPDDGEFSDAASEEGTPDATTSEEDIATDDATGTAPDESTSQGDKTGCSCALIF